MAADPRGVLRQGRAFLDFFWDIAKPEQEVRLAATENLLRHLKEGRKVRPGPGPAGGAVGDGRHRSSLRSRLETGLSGRRPGVRGGGAAAPPGSEERGHRPTRVSLSGRRAEVHPQAPGGRAGSHPRGRPPGLQPGPGAGQYCPEHRKKASALCGPSPTPVRSWGPPVFSVRRLEGSLLAPSACRWQGRLLQPAKESSTVLNGNSLF